MRCSRFDDFADSGELDAALLLAALTGACLASRSLAHALAEMALIVPCGTKRVKFMERTSTFLCSFASSN